MRAPLTWAALAPALAAALLAAAAPDAAAHTGGAPGHAGFHAVDPADGRITTETWAGADPVTAADIPYLRPAEFASISQESLGRLADGTAQISRIHFTPAFGSHAAVGLPLGDGEWTLVEGGAGAVGPSCAVAGGLEREMLEIVSARAGPVLFAVHEALSTTASRMHAIYHPGESPAIPGAEPNGRSCAYLDDRNDRVEMSLRSVSSGPAGTSVDRAVLSLGEDVDLRGTANALAASMTARLHPTCVADSVACNEAALGAGDVVPGPSPRRSFTITLPAAGVAASSGLGTGAFWEGGGALGLRWEDGPGTGEIVRANDGDTRAIVRDAYLDATDGLPPAPSAPHTGTSTVTQEFSEAPAGADPLDGVEVWRTTTDGTRQRVAATGAALSGTSVTFTASPPLAASDHVEYVGVRDAAGNASEAPVIVSMARPSPTLTVVGLNVPVSGTTEARQWHVGPAGGTSARASGVAAGEAAAVAADASAAGDTDVAVEVRSRLTLAHAAIPLSTPVAVEHRPPASHSSHADRLDGRLAASGVRLGAQSAAEASFAARATGPASIDVEFAAPASGRTAPSEWSVGGAATPASITVGAAPPSAGTVTLASARSITLNLRPADALAGTALVTTLAYTRPTLGAAPNSIAVGTIALPSTPQGSPAAVTDAIGPVALDARFDGPSVILVRFSEAVTTSGPWSVSPPLGEITASAGPSPDLVRLETARAATAGAYTVTIPPGVRDRASPPNGVDLSTYPTVGTTYVDRDTVTAFDVTFAGPRVIVLTASRPLAEHTAIAGNFAVTVPDGATGIDDADADPDRVGLAAAEPVTYRAGPPPTVTLRLAEDMVDSVTYTVTPSAGIADGAGTPYAGGAVEFAYALGGRSVATGGAVEMITWAGVAVADQTRTTFGPLVSDAEFGALGAELRAALAGGTAQLSRVEFSPAFGTLAEVGPALDAGEWTLVERPELPMEPVDTESCTRVTGAGSLREVLGVISVRPGTSVLIAHEALADTSADMYAIYHPDSTPSVPGTVPNSRGCDQLVDANTLVRIYARTKTTSASGFPPDRITLVFSESVRQQGNLAPNMRITADLDCRATATDCDFYAGPAIAPGPVFGRSFTITPTAAARSVLGGSGTGPFWDPDGRLGVSWISGRGTIGIKLDDGRRDVLPVPYLVQDVRDGLPPAPSAAITGSGTAGDPYVQDFSEAPEGTASTVFAGVRATRTAPDGTVEDLAPAVVSVAGTSVTYTSAAAIGPHDHVEYVGVRDAAGNASAKPAIESLTRYRDDLTLVTLSSPVSGVTEARQWLVGGGDSAPSARSKGVSVGIAFREALDRSDDGSIDRPVGFERHLVLSHDAVPRSSTLIVRYEPPGHETHAGRFADRLAASGVRLDAQTVRDVAPDTSAPSIASATLESATRVTVTMSEPVRGLVRGSEWNVGGVTFESGTVDGTTVTLLRSRGAGSTGVADGAMLEYTGAGSITDSSAERNALPTRASVALVDGAPPELAAGTTTDSLYTRARHVGAPADTRDPAGTGAQLRVYVRASEALTAAAGDLVLYGTSGVGALTAGSVFAEGQNLYAYSRTVAASDANGPVEFDLTVRDAAGNELSLDEGDLTSDRGAGSGHRTPVDTVAPTASAAFTGDAITVTFSESAYGVPATLAVTSPGRAPEALATEHDDGSRTARIAIAGEIALGSWAVATPPAITDRARNALATESVTAERTAAPTSTAVSYVVLPPTGDDARPAPFGGHAREGDRIALSLTLSEAVGAAPTVLFVGKTGDGAPMMPGTGTNEWAATYTVESASTAPGIDGTFTFAATVTGSTGSTVTLTPASHPSVAPPVIDRVAPSFSAGAPPAFSGTDLVVTFDEVVRIPGQALRVAVTAPGGSMAEAAASASGAVLRIPVGATVGGTYSAAIPASLTDLAGNARAGAAAVATAGYTPPDTAAPRATAISFAVHTGTPADGNAKVGTYALWAREGEVIRLSLTLDEDAAGAPSIRVPGAGRTPAATAMVNTGGGDRTTWHHDLAVGPTTAETVGGGAVPFEFEVAVEDALSNAGTITATSGHSGELAVTLPGIDRTAPSATVTTAVRLEGGGSDAPPATVAGIGDEVRVRVAAGEPLAAAAGDISLFGAQAAPADSVEAGPENAYTYVRTVAASDADGAIVFALTMRDRAGNTASLTHGDAAARVRVDATAPSLMSAETASTTTLTVTLSEALPPSAATAPGEWAVVDTVPDPDITATLTGASVSGSTVTLTYGEVTDTAFAPTVTYTGTGLADEGRNAVPSPSPVTAADGVGPVASNARFAGGSIVLDLSEPIATPPSSGYSAAATGAPAGNDLGTLTPSYTAGSETLTLSPQNAPTVDLATYEITLPALSDTRSPANSATTAGLTATVPDRTAAGAASLAVSVEDGDGSGGFMSRTGPNFEFVNEGDRVSILVIFDEDVATGGGAPMITVASDADGSRTAMATVADTAGRGWTHEFTVHIADGEGPLEFTIDATDAAPAMNMGMITQDDITSGRNAVIDLTPPTLDPGTSVDALYTRARHAGEPADTADEPAGEGAQARVYARAAEPLVVTASDIAFYAAGLAASGAEAATSAGANSYAWWRTVGPGDANGPLEFDLTIRDRAGNTASLTHDDLTTGRGAGSGHRVSVDTAAPTATAAFMGDAIAVMFSEGVYGVPATLSVTPPAGTAAPAAATHADGGAAVSIPVSPPVALGTWTVDIPAGVTDQARNPRATPSVTAERGEAPSATVDYTVLPPTGTAPRPAPFEAHAREGDRITLSLTLSEAVRAAPTVLFVGKTAAADRVMMAAGAGTNEWVATYTVEPAADEPSIDGPFAFVATVTGDTGSTRTVTQEGTMPPVIDRVDPAISSAAFSEANTITVTLSERMARGAATIQGYTYTVTAPDGTNTPDDADSDADVIALSSTVGPAYAEQETTSMITLTLAAGAADGVTHTVELPTQLTDEAGNELADRTGDATYDPPLASALTFAVHTGVPSASNAKAGSFASWAGVGDRIVMSLDLDADAASAPLITLAGRGTDAVAMADAGDADASTWEHVHEVLASHASTSQASPLDMSIRATVAAGSVGTITATSGLAAGTTVALPTIDTVRPALDTGDSLRTVTVYVPAAGGDAVSGRVTAGVGDRLWVVLDATEPLATPALEMIPNPINGATTARPDMTFFAGTASARDSATATEADSEAHVYNYSTVIAAGDPEGPVTFSLVIRDRAGNDVALTHADLTASATDADGGPIGGAGYRAPVDSSVPELSSASTTSTTTLEVTLSEALPASASTVPSEWSAVDPAPTPDVAATVTAATVAGATVTLTYGEIADTSFAPAVSYAGTALADAGRNAVSALPVTAADGVGPAASNARFVGDDIVMDLSEPIAAPPSSGYSAAPTGAPAGNDLGTLTPSYTAGPPTLTLEPQNAPTVDLATYEITLPALSDTRSPANSATTAGLTATVPDRTAAGATFLGVGVEDGDGSGTFTPRTGANAEFADENDRVSIRVTFDEDVATGGGAPMITVASDADGSRAAMDPVAGTAGRGWEHAFTVHAGDAEGPLEFTIDATDAAPAMNMGMITQDDITSGTNAVIDLTPPTLDPGTSIDALYTRARHAGEPADTVDEPAGEGAQARVYARAAEPLVVTASDIAFYAAGLAASGAAEAAGAGPNSYVWWRIVGPGDANGPLEFDLTIRDRAGNTADLTHDDLTTGRGAGSGHRTSVDTAAPTASAAFAGDEIVVTFSEPVYGVPASLRVTPPGGAAAPAAAAHSDGGTAVSIPVSPPVALGTWTVDIPAGVTDQARNPRATPSVTAERGEAPSATAISYAVLPPTGTAPRPAPFEAHAREGDRITLSLTLSEAVRASPTVLFVGKTTAADRVMMASGAGTNEWVATYTVEPAADAPSIDGPFTFGATVTGDTGGTAVITQASRLSPGSRPPPAPPVIDRVAPAFGAQTADLTTLTVTFDEPVRGTTVVTEWGVAEVSGAAGEAPETIASGAAATAADLTLAARSSLTLSLATAGALADGALADGAARPYVSFAGRSSGGITDLAGNALAATSSPHVRATDRIPPRLASIEFTDADTLTVTLSEPIDAGTIRSLPAGSVSPPLGAVVPDYAAGSTTLTLNTQRAAAERATHEFTMPTTATDAANAAGERNAFAPRSSASARLPDTTPPEASAAETVDIRTVAITFSEAMAGTTSASDWAAGVRPAGMPAAALPTATVVSTERGGTGSSVTIGADAPFTGPLYVGFAEADTGSHWGTGDTPAVSFTAPAGGGLTDAVPAGDTPNALATLERDATDGTPARVLDAVFVSATGIRVTFSEPVTHSPSGWEVTHAGGSLAVTTVGAGPAAGTVALTLSPPATEGTEYTLTIQPSAAADAAGNRMSAAHVRRGIMYQDTVTFTAVTARLDGSEHVRIGFSDPVTGLTRADEWAIGVEADGSGGTPATAIARVCGAPALPTMAINVAEVCDGDTGARPFYLSYDAPDSGATPRVAYRAPSGDGATPIVSALNGLPVSDRPVVAADGLPPLFGAATATSRTLTITFDEPVAGVPDASRWYHYDSSSVPPSEAELAAAVTAGTSFASASLAADGLTLTLTLPDPYMPPAGWGSGDTAAVPDTIGYSIPAGAASDLADMSPAANALAHNTAYAQVSDGAPPEATSLSLAVEVDPDGDGSFTPKSGPHARVAGAGDRIAVTLALSEAALPSPAFGALGVSAALSLDGPATTATGAIAVPRSWDRDGPLEFSIAVEDAASPPNAAAFTHEDLGEAILVDVSAPRILSVFAPTPSAVQLAFSEPVAGAGSVAVSPAAGTGSPAPLALHGDGSVATAPLSLATGTYTFTVDPTITDGAGNAFAAQDLRVEAGGSTVSETLVVPPSAPCDGPPLTVISREGPILIVLESIGPSGVVCPAITATIGGRLDMSIAAGTRVASFGPDPAMELAVALTDRLSSARLADPAASSAPAYGGATRDDADAAAAVAAREPAILAVLGKADATSPVLFGVHPVLIRLHGATGAEHAFYVDGASLDTVHEVRPCDEEGHPGATASSPPALGDAATPADAAACRTGDGAHAVIWTNHLTLFGATSQGASIPSSSCNDCTPPTLGVDSTGRRMVSGGFSYNGHAVDAGYYYTPMGPITVETGSDNTAVIRVFEDSGPHNVRHVGIAFGLERGQHFAESRAEIRVDIGRDGSHKSRIEDPSGTLDRASLRTAVARGACMAGSEAICAVVTIRHAFREPLELGVISTIVWDERRNAWQNFFNHGVRVAGEALNPRHGVPVNGGDLVLYPLVAGAADADGDGVYDFDRRHAARMLDAEGRVHVLTPAGTYEPARNLASLHHGAPEAPLKAGGPHTPHGPQRGTGAFEEALERERAIAEEIARGGAGPPPRPPGS